MTNAETTRKRPLGTVSLRVLVSDYLRRFWRELVIPPLNSGALIANLVPSFGVPVGGIVRRSSKPEMVRVDASRVVAFVKYPKPVRDWAFEKQPRGAMRSDTSLAPVGADFPISVLVRRGRPKPARISLVDFGQKALREVFRKSLLCQVLGRNFNHRLVGFAARITGPGGASIFSEAQWRSSV